MFSVNIRRCVYINNVKNELNCFSATGCSITVKILRECEYFLYPLNMCITSLASSAHEGICSYNLLSSCELFST